MVTTDSLTDISNLSIDELLARRAEIDADLEAKRTALLAQADRLGDVIANGKKRKRHTPKEEE